MTTTVAYRACPSATVTRNVTVLPQPQIYLGPDTSLCPGGTPLVLADMVHNANAALYDWIWNTGAATPAITVSGPGVYVASVSYGGCSAVDSVVVKNDCYIDLPNVFTPNADGTNDYFNPRDYLAKGLKTFNMDIYNRWGQLIFHTDQTSGSGWDGSFNNTPQPEGVYIYTISATFNDGQQVDRRGNLTLLK
jgi:gliding motility-associated-like protein